ncbi:MAG TPA: Rho-binding antiterminator [Thermoanaerobaculia bacterium]|nr:Rho-binding antiterminator [Thermoanaerobaculia bacterium]
MDEQAYKPVSCDYHDELEAASMHGSDVELDLDAEGEKRTARGKIKDVFTSEGAEYVTFDSGDGGEKIRLDKIKGFRELKNS